MSNSIWHDKNEKPVKVLYKNYIIITKWGSVLGESDVDSGYTIETDWAYLTDVIAQADKAERLEKENEAMREEFEVWHGNYECEVEDKKRLQKAVDKALYMLDYVSNEKFATGDGNFFEEYEEMHKAIKQGIDEIKKLIKETQ